MSTADDQKIVNKANKRASNQGRYVYKDVLGEGSFGSVLKATDRSTNEDVAIKIIKVKKSVAERVLFFMTPSSLKQGKKEVLILTDLQHKNITAIRDHFKFRKSAHALKSGLAIVMEYCPGGDLQTHLQQLAVQGKRTTEQERLSWFKQLASALAFIHQKGIAHRDLKPENILIGGDGQLKVADVGIAKTLYDQLETQGSYQNYMETVAGSYPYMAPEVFNEHYTTSSDIFSLGLVMFVICELPYDGKELKPRVKEHEYSLGQFLYEFHGMVSLQKPTSLMNVVHCPSDEQKLFDSMLQYNYSQRPTASKVLEDLKRIEEERRERERRELERRKADTRRREAERRRRVEDIRRRSEAERKQREREESGWCCIL